MSRRSIHTRSLSTRLLSSSKKKQFDKTEDFDDCAVPLLMSSSNQHLNETCDINDTAGISNANHKFEHTNAKNDDDNDSDDPNIVLDDFDIMLLHEDFPHLLAIAVKAKATRRKIAIAVAAAASEKKQAGTATTNTSSVKKNKGDDDQHKNSRSQPPTFFPPTTYLAKTALRPDDILGAVERMQQALLEDSTDDTQLTTSSSKKKEQHPPKKRSTKHQIPRGRYPITDSIMEDSMLLLQNEHECGEKWLAEHSPQTQHQLGSQSSSACLPQQQQQYSPPIIKRGRDDPQPQQHHHHWSRGVVAPKYSKPQTDILMNWMIEHTEAPYPDNEAVRELSACTGLTHTQVVNWMTNVRKRSLKATCEGGKKPHHFIDFLFLVRDRENKEYQELKEQQQQLQQDHYQTNDEPQELNDFYQPLLGQAKSSYGAPSNRKQEILAAPITSKSTSDKSSYHLSRTSMNRSQFYHSTKQYSQRSVPIPEECTSLLTDYTDCDAVPEMVASATKSDDPIMIDFSNDWTTANSRDKKIQGRHMRSVSALDLIDDDRVDNSHVLASSKSSHGILPAVTYDDNNSLTANAQDPPAQLPLRDGSFAFGSLDEEQLTKWALDVGHSFEFTDEFPIKEN